jgi:molecular chaperone GrpE
MTTGNADGTPPRGAASDETADSVTNPEPDGMTLEAELDDLRQKYLRAVADYQNLRRRSDEERKEWARYTLTSVILNYLPVLDDLDRALESVDADIAEHRWVEGVRMVQRKFRTVLESSGVQPIDAEGQPFDPAAHEAISYAPGPEGLVVAVVQAGYTVDGRVIRPARVVVGSGQPAPGAPGTQ